jgi:hypothetical protein
MMMPPQTSSPQMMPPQTSSPQMMPPQMMPPQMMIPQIKFVPMLIQTVHRIALPSIEYKVIESFLNTGVKRNILLRGNSVPVKMKSDGSLYIIDHGVDVPVVPFPSLTGGIVTKKSGLYDACLGGYAPPSSPPIG